VVITDITHGSERRIGTLCSLLQSMPTAATERFVFEVRSAVHCVGNAVRDEYSRLPIMASGWRLDIKSHGLATVATCSTRLYASTSLYARLLMGFIVQTL
jgi:hypothetical protein